MPPPSIHRKASNTTVRTRYIICTALASIPILTITEFLNPDWFGYKKIFSEGGSWLLDQGRDPLFLLLLSTFQQLMGEDSYDEFRTGMAIVFIVFLAFLCAGRILPYGPSAPKLLPMSLAVLLFTVTRFTITIREGLALVIFLIGLRKMYQWHYGTGFALVFAILAALVHGGTLMLLSALIISTATVWAGSDTGFSRLRRSHQWIPLAIVIGILAGLALSTSSVVLSASSRDFSTEPVLGGGLGKFSFWAATGLAVALTASEAYSTFGNSTAPPKLKAFVGVLCIFFLPTIYSATIIQIMANGSPELIAATIRAQQMIVALLVLMTTFIAPIRVRLMLVIVFLLIDQVRTVYTSLLTTMIIVTG